MLHSKIAVLRLELILTTKGGFVAALRWYFMALC